MSKDKTQYKKLDWRDREESKKRKKICFEHFIENPFESNKKLSEKFNVSEGTVANWKSSEEWAQWLDKVEGYNTQSSRAKIVKLTDDALQYADDLLNNRLDKDELKGASSAVKVLSLFLETSGLVNQKPFMQVNQTFNNNKQTLITNDDIKALSPDELKEFLITNTMPERITESKKQEEVVELPKQDYKEI